MKSPANNIGSTSFGDLVFPFISAPVNNSIINQVNGVADWFVSDSLPNPDGSYFVKWVTPKAFGNFECLKETVEFAKCMAATVEFVSPKEAAAYKKELNACIREGREIDHLEWDNPNLINFWKLVKSIKDDALFLTYQSGGPAAYIGEKHIDAEGYVMHSQKESWKLVDREVFSHANFANSRFARV